MGRRPKGKKRLNEAGPSYKKSYGIYLEKIKIFIDKERKNNNCNQKLDKEINPNENVQKRLVKYYEDENEQFKKALKLIKDKAKAYIPILDRTKDKQLNIEYIRGIIALYKYGEVSIQYLNANVHFTKVILAMHNICLYKPSSPKKILPIKKNSFDLLKNRINKNLNKIEVSEKTVDNVSNILKKLHKEAREESEESEEDWTDSEDDTEESFEEEIKLEPLEEKNKPLNFQPTKEEDDDYWIKWDLATRETNDAKLKKD